jgi:hypothetical protein
MNESPSASDQLVKAFDTAVENISPCDCLTFPGLARNPGNYLRLSVGRKCIVTTLLFRWFLFLCQGASHSFTQTIESPFQLPD